LLSVEAGTGLDKLIADLTRRVADLMGSSERPYLTRARHREALEDTSASLARAGEAMLPELVAEDVRMALRSLGRITGRVDVEDLLDIIFRDFCIGK
jgi:tRNA modification GTPase